MSSVITVENLGKRYFLSGTAAPAYRTLRDTMAEAARRLVDRDQTNQIKAAEAFWALRNVSFDVNEGDVVGVVGRNGAGKSTLLKVLSRITAPTEGLARIRGRVGSLLEVGTGFHPELSGRENIFFNGAILGLRKHEIRARFDEIVEFAGVAEFLDIPIKRYSSGMKMRLAFSVAAHLEPEIMIVDEVLAVGDAEFQKKCLGKMKDVANSGRTVLFVSHNLNAVMQLCSRVIWLERGQVREDSREVHDVCGRYLLGGSGGLKGAYIAAEDGALENEYFSLQSFRVCDPEGSTIEGPTQNDQSITIEIKVDIKRPSDPLSFGVSIANADGQVCFWTFTNDSAQEQWPVLTSGINVLRCNIPRRFLNEGEYVVELLASLQRVRWLWPPGQSKCVVQFSVSGGLSDSPFWYSARPGVVAPVLQWTNNRWAV
ncbi:hypothetical protein BOQ54_18765 (plasmid) [Chelatococcus daeguensis]|uniref:ABC transporter domain-containing protein n=1 Tax=Chelatococcus daeguensis TaxID=444444 RepID=A0AAC9JUR3_9HYPH|nr:ABC transporter ATP-binding protein [Chelatococcus daeguensis]APF39526.1 hypothetical protein BOQ54_18765 [Chelatococcus daeguensis]